MESKKIIAAALAATIAASVSPINVMGDNEIENFGLGYSEDDNNDDLMLMSAENIDVRKISETDTSITVSWSGFNTEKAAAYTVVCDGLESEKITDTTYTVVGLTGGCEYSIAVRAYDAAGEIVGVSDAIYAYTDWNIISDVTLTSNKTVADLNVSGNLNLNGYTLTVTGDAYLTSSTLFVNRGKMYVNGNFNMSSTNGNYGYGYLNMSNAEDYICVNGDFLAYSYYASSTLTDGTIEVKGNFNQKRANYANNFAPSGNHKVVLSGEGLQTVSFERTESGFNVLELQNYSDEGVVFSTPVTINNLVDNGCNTSFANGERSGWTLEADETIEGDLFLSRGTLDLNGHKLTVTGNLVQSGGTVLANGGELEVQGDYRVQSLSGSTYGNSTGVLNMTNEADTVRVFGSFVMQSTVNHSDKLTAGTLEIGGDLTQNSGANGYNFCTSGTHTIVLNGSEKQSVSIYDNGKNYSRINNLKITNTSTEGVEFARGTYVIGKLYNTDSIISNVTNLYICSTTVFADNAWNSDANFAENYTISDDLSIGGTVYLTGGTLKLNGHRLNVDGNFNMSSTNGNYGYGYLNMSNAEDYICVNGDFLAYSYYASSTLTDGTIEVKGNFNQKRANYANNFAPSGNHKVVLSGEGLQTVSFERTESGFNVLELQNYSDEGVVFSTPVTINNLVDNGCNTSFANGERSGWTLEADETIEGDLFLSRGTLDLNGHKLTVTGNLVQSGGTVLANGGELEVQGDYRVQSLSGSTYGNSTGVLNMTNEADTVRVFGSFVMQSTVNHSDKLTAGTLEIGGDLTQNSGANGYNFCTSGTHTIVLNGSEKQSVSIYDNGKNYSRINNLKITNTSTEGVEFARGTYVIGKLYNTDSIISNVTNLYICSTTVFADNAWNSDANFAENYTISDDLSIGGTVYLTGGTLKLNGHRLNVDGNFNMSSTNGNYGYGYLNMSNAEDYICVNGDFLAYSYYASSTLTDGTIEVKGNFNQKRANYANNFAPSGNHKVVLSGEGLQTVSFERTESGFNVLELQNYSDEGVVFSTPVTINNLVDNGCNTSFANGERSGWTLEADETIEGDLFLSRGTLDLNGHKLTVTGNLVQSGGTVLANGGELEVQGDYRVQSLSGSTYGNSTGVLNMTNEADTVRVFGSFVMQSTVNHSDKLTAGTLEIGGDLTQNSGANGYNFCTSGTHTIVLNGSEKQSVSIYDNGKNYSRINNLKITNTSTEGVEFARGTYVIGKLYNTDSIISNVTNLYICSTTVFADNAWNSDANFAENYTISDDLSIGGTVYLTGGTLKLNGHRLNVDGNFNMSSTNGNYGYGYLNMSNAEDYICVNGDFLAYSYYASSTLTDGTIEVKGNFNQKRANYANNFAPSGNHKVVLIGEGLQTVSFERTESGFNVLELQNYSDEGVVFSTPVTINNLVDNGCNTSFANGERSGWTLEADETIEGDLFLSRGTLDLNGHKLTVTGNLVQSGGTVLANGGELEVQGDYRVQSLSGSTYGNSTGVLNMTNEADTVRVFGSFVMQSTVNHSDKLTAGTLEIGGDLTQNSGANGYNFCTSGTHTIVLNGSEKQSVSIYDNGKNYSRINNLKITNTSTEGVEFARGTYVIGKLYNTDSIISNVTNLYICSTTVFADNAWNSDANFAENYTISDDLSIGGTVYLTGGTLKLNGHRLNVDGNFNMSSTNGNYGYGYLNMSNAEDYICVNGDFLAYSYYASSTLTDGTIEVKGNFNQKRANYANNFAPSGNHKVVLSGRGIQKVNFESEQSMFNILEITKPLETGYVFSRTPLWNELSEKNSDNEPPTAPENLHAERSTSTSIKITWNESEDESGIYCYYVYRDGEKVGSTKNLYYVDTGLKSHSQHMYYVIACDVDGNMSEKSDIIEAATDADEYAPTQPANFTAVVKGNSTIYLSWIASSDNVKVVEYNIYRNGVLIAKTEGTAYTDKNAFAGLYTYYVEAVDNEGNVSTASKKVTVDNEAPTKPILTLSKVGDSYISLEWICSDNVGVTFYNIYRNNVLVKTVSANSYVDTNISIDSHYTYCVVAYDASENKSEASNEVSVYTGEDSTAPEINSIHTAKNKYAKSVPISVSATDNRAVAAIYVQSSVDNITWEDVLSIKADGKTSSNVIGNLDLTEYSDGELYLRAYAEDLSGNRSSADDSPVFCITVDNTAPKTPYDLSASTENGSLELKWDTAENDNDIEYFKIYRRENDESDYTLAEDNYRYWNYIDSNIEIGTRYYYAVSAVDDVGNESLLSQEVMNCISDDKIKPEVLCVTPVTNSKIGEDPKISISCYDNFKLKEVVVECKSSNSDEWAEVFAKDIDSYGEIVSFTLDTSEFTTGVYQLKVSLTDSALNKSDDYIVDYDYRKCSLSAPILTATGAGWSVDLDWSMTNTEEIAGYYVYRRSAYDSKYTLIGSVKDMYMTDKNAEAGQKYYYYIEAVDIRGNKIEGNTVSAVPTDEDNIAPVAYMGEGLYGIENKTVSFDGTGSQDNHYVSSYLWDFGDGVTSNDARPKHSYNKAGIYTVSLTVYDSAGNNNTAETEITIYDKDYKGTKLRIRGSDGNVLSGARIYSEMQDRTINASADSSGCYEYIAKKGSYDVYVYREGYIPQMITINVSDEASEFDVVLPKGEVVVGSLETRPLELNEILALGIDPTNPANQKVCEYIVKLEYNKEKKELRLCTGMSGEIINFKQTTNEKWQVYPKTICNSDGETEAITLFSVHTEMSWLKEFYNVDLTIINMADEHFSLEQCEAALTVPYGLSLAGNSFTSTKKENKDIVACVDAGVIKGGETKTISWILRGDSRGEYNLSADFSCVLTPFMEDISLNFKTKEPLVVYGGSALELSVDLTAFDPQKDYWTAKFILKNVSDKPVYNVNFDFKAYSEFDGIEVTDLILKYPSGLTEHIPPTGKEEFLPVLWTGNESIDLRTLNPGEYITGYYSISDFQQFIERN